MERVPTHASNADEASRMRFDALAALPGALRWGASRTPPRTKRRTNSRQCWTGLVLGETDARKPSGQPVSAGGASAVTILVPPPLSFPALPGPPSCRPPLWPALTAETWEVAVVDALAELLLASDLSAFDMAFFGPPHLRALGPPTSSSTFAVGERPSCSHVASCADGKVASLNMPSEFFRLAVAKRLDQVKCMSGLARCPFGRCVDVQL